MPVLVTAIVALITVACVRRVRRQRHRGRAVIVTPSKSTVIASDGAVRSVQSALLTVPQDELRRLWNRASLEDLGRTYWRFLSRAMIGLVHVRYTEREREVVLLMRPLTLLRFDAPEYEFDARRGRISWRIKDGLLVSRRAGRGSGWLSLEVQAEDPTVDPARLLIEVEVANFYPSIASRIGTAFYKATQAFVHVSVTHAFLRSLAKLNLAESKVRRFSEDDDTDTVLAQPQPETTAADRLS